MYSSCCLVTCISVGTRHQPRQVSYRHNPADPDVPHSERTDLPPVLQLFPSGDADVADTFKDNPQTAIDMGEDTEDDHPPAVSSPSADSKAPSDLGTIQFHYNLIKNEYSPVDTEPVSDNLQGFFRCYSYCYTQTPHTVLTLIEYITFTSTCRERHVWEWLFKGNAQCFINTLNVQRSMSA